MKLSNTPRRARVHGSLSLILSVLILLVFAGCKPRTGKLRLIYSEDEPLGFISEAIERILERELDVDVERVLGHGSISNLDSLQEGTADMTIVENFVPLKDSVRTLLAFYPQILHIFYQSDHKITSMEELLYDKTVFMGLENSGSYRFMKELIEYFDLDTTKFVVTDNPWDNDVFAGFSDMLRQHQLHGLGDFRIYSFDKMENYGKGSVVEGISLRFPKVKPFIIPDSTYGSLSHDPILTISTESLLVCSNFSPNLDRNLAYDITKTIFKFSQEFVAISPLIRLSLREDFDRQGLSFHLHEGARIYLDRDEPTFAERYAELSGVILSVIIAFSSGLISIGRWKNRVKKNRVDVFYKELLRIKADLDTLREVSAAEKTLLKIKRVERKAFDMLINEKVEANESFRIYMDLSARTAKEVETKIGELESK